MLARWPGREAAGCVYEVQTPRVLAYCTQVRTVSAQLSIDNGTIFSLVGKSLVPDLTLLTVRGTRSVGARFFSGVRLRIAMPLVVEQRGRCQSYIPISLYLVEL
jgi:hypothetical protein